MDPFEEVSRRAQEAYETQRMMIEGRQQALHEFFDNLGGEDLALMSSYTQQVAMSDAFVGAYWQGMIDQKLRARGLCEHCGKDHLTQMLGEDHKAVPAEEKVDLMAHVPVFPEVPENEVAVAAADWVQPELDLAGEENIRENATTWGVYFKDASDLKGRVICGECGTEFVSLEDRMLREPGIDGCSTCQQKAMWG